VLQPAVAERFTTDRVLSWLEGGFKFYNKTALRLFTARVGLGKKLDSFLMELSSPMKQRVHPTLFDICTAATLATSGSHNA